MNLHEISVIIEELDIDELRSIKKPFQDLKAIIEEAITGAKVGMSEKIMELLENDDYEGIKKYKQSISALNEFISTEASAPQAIKKTVKQTPVEDTKETSITTDKEVEKIEVKKVAKEEVENKEPEQPQLVPSKVSPGFKPQKNQKEYTLEDNLSNKKPSIVEFEAQMYNVYSWRELAEAVCRKLNDVDHELFASFVRNKTVNGTKSRYFSKASKEMDSPVSIGDVYVDVAKLTNNNFFFMKKVLRLYGYALSDVKIYVDPDFNRKIPVIQPTA